MGATRSYWDGLELGSPSVSSASREHCPRKGHPVLQSSRPALELAIVGV